MKKALSYITIALFFGATISCTEERKNPMVNTKSFFEGKWQAKRLAVLIHTVFGGTADSALLVGPDEFINKLHVKPHTLEFFADGSYSEKYYNDIDSVILANSGTWRTQLDTLKLTQIQPFNKVSDYKFIPNVDSLGNSKGLNLYQIVDFDFDGKADDEYTLFMAPFEVEEKSWWEKLFS